MVEENWKLNWIKKEIRKSYGECGLCKISQLSPGNGPQTFCTLLAEVKKFKIACYTRLNLGFVFGYNKRLKWMDDGGSLLFLGHVPWQSDDKTRYNWWTTSKRFFIKKDLKNKNSLLLQTKAITVSRIGLKIWGQKTIYYWNRWLCINFWIIISIVQKFSILVYKS